MSEFERIGMLHPARTLLSLNGWFMFLNFCVSGIVYYIARWGKII